MSSAVNFFGPLRANKILFSEKRQRSVNKSKGIFRVNLLLEKCTVRPAYVVTSIKG